MQFKFDARMKWPVVAIDRKGKYRRSRFLLRHNADGLQPETFGQPLLGSTGG